MDMKKIRQYADEDIAEVIDLINDKLSLKLRVAGDPKVDEKEFKDDNYQECHNIKYTYQIENGFGVDHSHTVPLTLEYDICDDEVYYGNAKGLEKVAEESLDAIRKAFKDQKIQSTTILHTSKITAADDEEEEVFVDDIQDEDGDVEDIIEDVSDKVDDLQESVDEIDEDSVDIEIENNIADHYIAECDACHGVFISAMIKSDEKVDHISGICPLCNKDTDQYLKWIAVPVEDSDE